jgi:hypothetical protein
VLRHWRVDALEGLSPEAERAREKLHRTIQRLEQVGRRQAERLARRGGQADEGVLSRS